MQVRQIAPDELEVVQALLVAGGWEQRAADLTRFSELVARSQVALVAIVDDSVVGFVRCLTDGISNGYISKLVVDPQVPEAGYRLSACSRLHGRQPGHDVGAARRQARARVLLREARLHGLDGRLGASSPAGRTWVVARLTQC